MSRPGHANRQNRVVQMCQQEEIIQRKKREILERQQKTVSQQSPPSVDGETSGPSGLPFKNTFSNDGSFLENFKKLTQAANFIEQQGLSQSQEEGEEEEVNDAAINTPAHQDGGAAVILEQDIDPDKPNTVQELVEMVVAAGDGGDTVIEDRLRSRKNLPRQLWFLFDLNSSEFKSYRNQVETARAAAATKSTEMDLLAKRGEEIAAGTSKMASAATNANYGQFVTLHRGNCYRDEEDENTEDSDTEYRREAKERNLKNIKNRLVCHFEDTDSSSSDQMDQPKYEGSRFNQHNFRSISSGVQEGSAAVAVLTEAATSAAVGTIKTDSAASGGPSPGKKRKKSRWDEESATGTTTTATAGTSSSSACKKSKIDRSDPEVIQLAVNSFGSAQLDEEQWEKVEQQFQIRRVYNEMLAKRQEIDRLAKSGRFKYEYDSDEDLDGGTWEHKMRKAEMETTRNWAETTTTVNSGRHHIGDFLPPDELKKFLDQHDKKKRKEGGGGGSDEPVTDYQDKKLTEENKGFQMLQKLGWKDGEGLGASGSGIVNPINKSAPRESNQGLGVNSAYSPEEEDNEFDAYRKRMMLAYRFRPNPMNNPRRAYY